MSFNIFIFTTICCYLQPVYASMPGIVEASVLWEGWETLGLILGVSTEFNENLTISKNNEIQYNYYYDKIMNDDSLSSSEKANLVSQLDTTRNSFVDNIVNIGSDLWNWITRIIYSDKVQVVPNIYPYLSNFQQQVFNTWSGTCAVAYYNGGYWVFQGDGLLQEPYLFNVANNGNRSYYISNSGNIKYVDNTDRVGSGGSPMPITVYSGYVLSWQYIPDKIVNEIPEDNSDNSNSLVGSPSWQDYIDGITGNFSIVDGSLVDVNTGDAPIVLDGETLDNTISGIQDGTLTYEQAIEQAFDNTDNGEITDYPSPISKKALDELIAGLNLSRLENKFPFCIPHDMQLILNGATAVSSNAPVIDIPLHIEYKDHVYYDNEHAIHIDFNDFAPVANIFREGFFLLFLIGLIWASIEILQAFFVVTE